MPVGGQIPLFGQGQLAFDDSFRSIERIELDDGAWIEMAHGWLKGERTLFEFLFANATWVQETRTMYEHRVDVPRLLAAMTPAIQHPIVEDMREALNARYQTVFARTSLALYRDGKDSVAWHGDYVARRLPQAVVATISLGAERTFRVRRMGGGASLGWRIGGGDLVVMGGTCQCTHQHSVPKTAGAASRIALMYRPVWKRVNVLLDDAPLPAAPGKPVRHEVDRD